jgi:hypothetical protein
VRGPGADIPKNTIYQCDRTEARVVDFLMAFDTSSDTSSFSFPPEPNMVVGCGCVGATVYSHTRSHPVTGVTTRTWRCGTCGDARVEFVSESSS